MSLGKNIHGESIIYTRIYAKMGVKYIYIYTRVYVKISMCMNILNEFYENPMCVHKIFSLH